ncbi:hypothetical protein H3222_11730 [Pseudomonas chengduensis]|nr:hypothetical protein [Pseudomonas chengduensis]MBG0845881.1 hypothetical protein [Pseudomonas chengduensis]
MNAPAKLQQLSAKPATLKALPSKTQKNRLRFKPLKKRDPEVFSLPFVGKDHGQFSYWDVPLSSGFLPGCYLGRALAGIYLNYIRDSECIIKHGLLGDISAAWLDKARACSQEELVALRGQVKGFIGKVNPCQLVTGWPGEVEYNAPRSDEQYLSEANHWLALGGDAALLAIVSAAEKPAKE